MTPRAPRGDAPVRRFFLARTPEDGGPALEAEDARHALRVLRLGAGDRLLGLDGRGGEWPLVVSGVERRGLVLEAAGDPRREPAPGAPGSALPWIEVAAPLPRGARAEAMVDRLSQLGAAALTPLLAERATPASGPERSHRRLERAAREACKQSGRLWLLRLAAPAAVEDLAARDGARLVVLDPGEGRGLGETVGRALDELPPGAPLVLVVGPEGGLGPAERELLAARGAGTARLGPHVLRIETAAEAAVAVAVDRALSRP